jgi:hypothetical protein
MKYYNLIYFLLLISLFHIPGQRLINRSGKVEIISKAPLETIKAVSNRLNGVIDLDRQEFAFSVDVRSFNGFNSPLQKEHFNENYLESNIYPKAVYTGKLLDNLDINKQGKYTIRSKGWLNIHGIAQEKIIKSYLEIKDKKLIINSSFKILLQEHNINIPLIVHQKIAEEIEINIHIDFNIK